MPLPGLRRNPGELLLPFLDHAATLEDRAATNGEEFYRVELSPPKPEALAVANGVVMRAD